MEELKTRKDAAKLAATKIAAATNQALAVDVDNDAVKRELKTQKRPSKQMAASPDMEEAKSS